MLPTTKSFRKLKEICTTSLFRKAGNRNGEGSQAASADTIKNVESAIHHHHHKHQWLPAIEGMNLGLGKTASVKQQGKSILPSSPTKLWEGVMGNEFHRFLKESTLSLHLSFR